MDLRALRYFVEIAKQKSFTLAAEKLFVTQPTLSRQITDLEKELGQQLLDRTTRHLELTEKGAYLFHQAQILLDLAEKTRLQTMAKSDLAGEIAIAGAETPAVQTVVRAMAGFRREHPGVRFRFQSQASIATHESLRLGTCDFAVFLEPVDLKGLEWVPLPLKSVYGVLVPAGSPLAAKGRVEPGDLLGLEVYITESPMLRNRIASWLGQPFSALKVIGTYNLLYNLSFLPEHGVSVVCIDGLAVAGEHAVFAPFDPPLTLSSVFAWSESRPKKALTEAFLETVKKAASENIGTQPSGTN